MPYSVYRLTYGNWGTYIGSTGDPRNRMALHRRSLSKHQGLPDRLLVLSRVLDPATYSPTMEVLRTFELKSAAQAAERVLIAHEADLDRARAGVPVLLNAFGTKFRRSAKTAGVCVAHGATTVYTYADGRSSHYCPGCTRERYARAAGLPVGPNPPPTSSKRRHDPSTQTSRYAGVYRRPAKRPTSKEWMAAVSVGGVSRYLGVYRTEEEAARAYDDAVMLHGLDRLLNFPDGAAAQQPPELDGQLSLLDTDNTDNTDTEPKDAR